MKTIEYFRLIENPKITGSIKFLDRKNKLKYPSDIEFTNGKKRFKNCGEIIRYQTRLEAENAVKEYRSEILFSNINAYFCDYHNCHHIGHNKKRDEKQIKTREKHFFNPTMEYEKIIVHGHTPREKIEKLPCRINLDTGSFYSGKLSCLLIEDQQLSFMDTLSN